MKITIADALKEGNWDAASWSPRIADDTAFQTWVGTIAARAAAYLPARLRDSRRGGAGLDAALPLLPSGEKVARRAG